MPEKMPQTWKDMVDAFTEYTLLHGKHPAVICIPDEEAKAVTDERLRRVFDERWPRMMDAAVRYGAAEFSLDGKKHGHL